MRTKDENEIFWHVISPARVLEDLETSEAGLSSQAAAGRLDDHGLNILPRKPPTRWWLILLRQFLGPFIYILAVAAMVSIAIGEIDDAIFIGIVLVLNAVIGGIQEWKAEQSSRALQQVLRIRASVVRDGEVIELDAEQIVPGDIIWLESGNRVPADTRLLSTRGLEIDESLLSGESRAVLKDSGWTGVKRTPVADRLNMAFAGSIVVHGRGKGVVVGTGVSTIVGRVAMDVLITEGGRPPLITRMEAFSRVVAVAMVAVSLVIGAIGVLVQGYTIPEMFLFGVALAVAAIPEGLPVALTIALAVATTRMARRRVIVRRLPAVEGLGSCTYIASDKTGTLTCNELTVRQVRLSDGQTFSVTGEGYTPEGKVLSGGVAVEATSNTKLADLARAAVLCNEADLHHRDHAWIWRGDPTDIALLSLAHKLGTDREAMLDRCPQVNEIAFEPEHQFSASFNRDHDEVRVYVKGAPERVIEMWKDRDDAGAVREWNDSVEKMAVDGFRVLALAQGSAPADLDPSQTPPEPSELQLIGFVGMIDPLRPGVIEAVTTCNRAGVPVAMVTGDHPVTALAIARELGLAQNSTQVITGSDLQALEENDLPGLMDNTRVFARVAPRQKLTLVNAARAAGHIVAVTGDGVNDAPALRAANIGVAMGRSGTDIAREAAELVISDDNFATIPGGIEEGRIAYDNVRKVILLLVTTGTAELILVCLAVFAGMPLPLLPVQLLWLNLVTNGIQDVALAFEPGEGDVLERKPRPAKEPIFNRLMIERTILGAAVMGLVSFGTFGWLLNQGWSIDSARNAVLFLMVLFENVHIGNSRSETQSAFAISPLRSPILLIGTLAAFLTHLVMLYLPVGHKFLKTEPMSFLTIMVLFALALTVLVAIEVHKLLWKRRMSST